VRPDPLPASAADLRRFPAFGPAALSLRRLAAAATSASST